MRDPDVRFAANDVADGEQLVPHSLRRWRIAFIYGRAKELQSEVWNEVRAYGCPPGRSGHESLQAARLPSRNQCDLISSQQPDRSDAREVARALLDTSAIVEFGQPRQKLRLHVDASCPWIVVDADRNLDRLRNALVVLEHLVRRQRPIGDRQHHDGIATDILRVL